MDIDRYIQIERHAASSYPSAVSNPWPCLDTDWLMLTREQREAEAQVGALRIKINRSHARTPTENSTPGTHTHDKNNAQPPKRTPHKHLTTLEGGATTVRATSHALVGGRAENTATISLLTVPLSPIA